MMLRNDCKCSHHIVIAHPTDGPHSHWTSGPAESDDDNRLAATLDVNVRRGMLARGSVDPDHEAVLPEYRRHRRIT